jgi:AmmeMemoRadiSam system protein B
MFTTKEPRPSPIAGTWYSKDPVVLAGTIDAYLSGAVLPELPGEVVALVAPHAGHRYSGRTAGHAFRCVLGKTYDLVVVISPLHGYHPDFYLTTAHPAYTTPLGEMLVDWETLSGLSELLSEDGGPGITSLARDTEHSLEIELPFLQRALKGEPKLLPLMVRNQSPEVAKRLGTALGKILQDRSVLLVASSDLSHFYPEEIANGLDGEMLRQLEAFSPQGMLEAECKGTGFACGVAAVAAVLWAARDLGADTVRVLHHSTSADETRDRSSVVGYGAAVILKTL